MQCIEPLHEALKCQPRGPRPETAGIAPYGPPFQPVFDCYQAARGSSVPAFAGHLVDPRPVVAQQAADHTPRAVLPDLDIALGIDANLAVVAHSGGAQTGQFILGG